MERRNLNHLKKKKLNLLKKLRKKRKKVPISADDHDRILALFSLFQVSWAFDLNRPEGRTARDIFFSKTKDKDKSSIQSDQDIDRLNRFVLLLTRGQLENEKSLELSVQHAEGFLTASDDIAIEGKTYSFLRQQVTDLAMSPYFTQEPEPAPKESVEIKETPERNQPKEEKPLESSTQQDDTSNGPKSSSFRGNERSRSGGRGRGGRGGSFRKEGRSFEKGGSFEGRKSFEKSTTSFERGSNRGGNRGDRRENHIKSQPKRVEES